jgi:23S rRNA (uracil1939-C5)-methyltransferase
VNKGDDVTLVLETFAFEGKSIARLDGLVVFVTGGVPGDLLRARVRKVKKQFAEAEAIEVLTPSGLRTAPRCPYFGTCGGCKWQHVEYQAQLDFKRQHVVDALERIGGFRGITVNPALGAERIYEYRNKMEFSFGDRWLTREEMESETSGGGFTDRFALGLHIPQRYDRVLDLHECHLQSGVGNTILNTVRTFAVRRHLPIYSTVTHSGYLRNLVLRESTHTGELMVNLVTSDDRPEVMKQLAAALLAGAPSITTIINNITDRKSQVAIGDREVVYHGPGTITERIGTKTFRISANSFFQTNTFQAERLYATAKRMARLQGGDLVYDLYSGTGSIALFLADDVAEVIGIESVASSVEDARQNAAMNDVHNCTFILGDLKDTLTKETEWLTNRASPSVVIVDPPRSGMHGKAVLAIAARNPERIVYVSCNPATQARDLKLLCENSTYVIDEVQPVDMFPHTYHIENVVGLSRPAG